MRRSEHVDQLVAAAVRARAGFTVVRKDKTAKVTSARGNYSYTYADLGNVFDAAIPALTAQGLWLVQAPHWDRELNAIVLTTSLFHVSGQYLESDFPMLGAHERPQEFGSALTYYRRYTASAILAIAAEEDDDGGQAEDAASRPRPEPAKSAPAKPKPAPAAPPPPPPAGPAGVPIALITTTVVAVSERDQGWYAVKFAEGTEAFTKNEIIVDRASEAHRTKALVRPEVKPDSKGKFYLNGLSILPASDADGRPVDAAGNPLAF